MTIADRIVPDAIVAVHVPDMRQRLMVPILEEQTGVGPGQRENRLDAMAPPAPPHLTRPKLSLRKRLERYIAAFFKLGRIEWMAKQALRSADQALRSADQTRQSVDQARQSMDQARQSADRERAEIADGLHNVQQDVGRIWPSISQMENAQESQRQRFEILAEIVKANDAIAARAISDLGRRLDLFLMHQLRAVSPAEPAQTTFSAGSRQSEGFRAFCDQFYHRFEDRYRGSRTEIANRLRIYLPDAEAAVIRCNGKPALDIACGRAEWLGLLKQAGIAAFGVDTNSIQIDAGLQEGLDVRLGDAIAFLAEAESDSLSIITAHHFVEHLPFDTVAWIAREAMRVLAPGGLLLFETPDTHNILVGATTFHTDPTHLKPMPEQVLKILFETAGYHPIDVRRLHPHERLDEFLAKPNFDRELAYLLFGPQDLAILGIKPTGE
ncbi:MAG: class I SAM-dependent methyltransferase [Bryobacteraceae bacterium]